MASSSIASQLQVIKSQLRGAPEPLAKRPFTRPSLLFDPKEAADVDIRTILPIALSGLDVLVGLDSAFQNYRTSLFSAASLDVDREKLPPKDEARLDKSIAVYLRLLAAHLQLPAAVKTLEYLIRRYKVHVYNVDDLLLCALPYHDTHVFVRIVQLIEFRNNMWSFLEGVKGSGAPPPRSVIVQQCLRDKGVLEALCNYASSTREFVHGRTVICFCTSVIVEALGSVPKLDDETVKRVLPFVFNGLNPMTKAERDEKAGALMVVGLMTTRATLAPKLVTNLLFCISRLAQQDTNEVEDLSWLRIIVMAIISLVQSQSIHMLPEKSLKVLVQIRDLPGVLVALSHNFNIRRFLSIFLETVAYYSCSDDRCCSMLATLLDAIPVKDIVQEIIGKLLGSFVRLSKSGDDSALLQKGIMVKRVLSVIIKNYKTQLSSVLHKFLENPKRYSMEEEAMQRTIWLLFGGSLEKPMEINESDTQSKIMGVVEQASLSQFPEELKEAFSDPLMLVDSQEAILQRLRDNDLKVVHATLLMKKLPGMVEPLILLQAFKDVLFRCLEIVRKGPSDIASRAQNIVITCLNDSVRYCSVDHPSFSKEVSKMLFPLLLIFPKTSKINFRALELAKEIEWPFYHNSFKSLEISSMDLKKTLGAEQITRLNVMIVRALVDSFQNNIDEYKDWLIECSEGFEPSKSLVLCMLLQLVLNYEGDIHGLLRLYDLCFPIVKSNWLSVEHKDNLFLADEFEEEKLEAASRMCINELLSCKFESGNAYILTFISWAFLQGLASRLQVDTLANVCPHHFVLEDLFIFFTSSSHKLASKELAFFLVTKCISFPVQFLSRFYTGAFPVSVQDECLRCFSRICSGFGTTNARNTNALLQLLISFPSLLVPLSCETKSTRMAAIGCIDELFKLWHQFDISRMKNGNNSQLSDCVSSPTFGKFLGLLISRKKIILSDVNFLPSFITSILGPSSEGFMVPAECNERFSQRSKDVILAFILRSVLELPSYSKVVIFSLLKGIGYSVFKVHEVKLFFSDLVARRNQKSTEKPRQCLSADEIQIICILLETSLLTSDPCHFNLDLVPDLFKSLRIDNTLLNEPAILQPCLTALQNVTYNFYKCLKTEMQEELFFYLVLHFHNEIANIRDAAKDAIVRIKFSCATIVKFLDVITSNCHGTDSLKRMKREESSKSFSFLYDEFLCGGGTLSLLGSVLEIILLKKDMEDRHFLLEPLFNLLRNLFSANWIHSISTLNGKLADSSTCASLFIDTIASIQQSTLIVLKDICSSATFIPEKIDICKIFNIGLLIECAHVTTNFMTRNHIFLLICAFAKVSSDWVSQNMLDLFGLIGEAATKQYDNHSQEVLESLISTLIPCWLSKSGSTKALLEVFLQALPQIAEQRRLKLTVYLLRTLGEKKSLGCFLALLFRDLLLRTSNSFDPEISMSAASFMVSKHNEWEYLFSKEICSMFLCSTWLPSLLIFFEEVGNDSELIGCCYERILAMHFIMDKLQDTELYFELESGKNLNHQCTIRQLMEEVILRLQPLRHEKKQLVLSGLWNLLKETEEGLLRTITKIMVSSEFFNGVVHLLDHEDLHVRRKALQLIRDVLKNDYLLPYGHRFRKKNKNKQINEHPLHQLDDLTMDAFNKMAIRIISLVKLSMDDTKASVKLVAISCLEIFCSVSPSNDQILIDSLAAVVKHVMSNNWSLVSTSIHCAASLVSVLGAKALVELPNIMQHIFLKAYECSNGMEKHSSTKMTTSVVSNASIAQSILLALEAIIEHLGCFLNPYLEDLMRLLVTHPGYILVSNIKMKAKADSIRKLIMEKVPIRLTLPPLLKLYPKAVNCGEGSLILAFEMLASAVSSMDRSSIENYHGKIFEHCLVALDLRRVHPDSIENVNLAEQMVIHTIVALTMKLTESMFRPLFLHTLEWADSELESSESLMRSVDRMISFYSLVNELLEQQRSLFVPYFKYLLDGVKNCLTDGSSSSRKRKKSKISETGTETQKKGHTDLKQWHLRALVTSSLYKCFFYDAGNLKFLDSSNFQVLLKPIVSQLVVEPPLFAIHPSNVPTVEEVDESLVCCLGQMAVTAGSDDIWKQLNHEVLMQTRSEKIRPRILGLRVVKFLMDHLKEEYLILLPETIPFLSELLEDVEHPVKSLAQEVFRDLETLSGENLKEYL